MTASNFVSANGFYVGLAGPSGRECTEIYGPSIIPGRVAEQKASQIHTYLGEATRKIARLSHLSFHVLVCSCSDAADTLMLRKD